MKRTGDFKLTDLPAWTREPSTPDPALLAAQAAWRADMASRFGTIEGLQEEYRMQYARAERLQGWLLAIALLLIIGLAGALAPR